MAHTHAAIKALRKSKKLREKNTLAKRQLHYLRKHTLQAIEKKDTESARASLQEFTKAIDKAAGKKMVKKNTAARKKSRLSKKLNALTKNA